MPLVFFLLGCHCARCILLWWRSFDSCVYERPQISHTKRIFMWTPLTCRMSRARDENILPQTMQPFFAWWRIITQVTWIGNMMTLECILSGVCMQCAFVKNDDHISCPQTSQEPRGDHPQMDPIMLNAYPSCAPSNCPNDYRTWYRTYSYIVFHNGQTAGVSSADKC